MKSIVFLGIAALGLSACADLEAPHQVIAAPANPNFTLFVSNQSFEMTPVDISVYVDDKLAVVGDFEVGSQHSWFDFDFQLGAGVHQVRGVTKQGRRIVSLTSMVEVSDDHDFGVLTFWTDREGAEFHFVLQDEEPVFE
ncbi:MAG: hypothetical protein R3B48_09925 [Kofleriaceae bacterium]